MTGKELAVSLMALPRSLARYRKCVRHITSEAQYAAFLAELSDEERAAADAAIRPLLRF